MPKGRGGQIVTLHDGGRLTRLGVLRVAVAVLNHDVRLHERRVPGQAIGPIDQAGIESEHHVAQTVFLGLFVRFGLAERHIPRGPVGGDFPRVNFMGQIAVDDVLRPGGAAQGPVGWIDAGDARGDPVGLAEVEPRISRQGRDDGCGSGDAAPGAHGQHPVVAVAQGPVGSRNLQLAVQVLTLDPELVFPGAITGVFARLEQGHDHHLDGHGRGFRRSTGWRRRHRHTGGTSGA